MGSLYGAGNTTAGLLSSLNQQALANRQAGLGVASTGQSFANMPYEQQLAAAARSRGMPLQTLQTLAQLGVPIAGLGSSFANTGAASGTTSGTQSGTQIGNTTGASTQTTSTPFNPWSLAPLAFCPRSAAARSAAASSDRSAAASSTRCPTDSWDRDRSTAGNIKCDRHCRA